MGAYGLFDVELVTSLAHKQVLEDLAEVLDHALGVVLPLGFLIFVLAVCTEEETEVPIIDGRVCPCVAGAQLLFSAVVINRMEAAG